MCYFLLQFFKHCVSRSLQRKHKVREVKLIGLVANRLKVVKRFSEQAHVGCKIKLNVITQRSTAKFTYNTLRVAVLFIGALQFSQRAVENRT